MATVNRTPTPCGDTVSSQSVGNTVYSQTNFTHFTTVSNYLVFYYYNIYLILQKIFLIINISIFKLIILLDCKSLFTKEHKQGLF